MKIFIAEYVSPEYPEDNRRFGAYTTEAAAQARAAEELAWAQSHDPRYPELYQKRAENYYVTELELLGLDDPSELSL